MIENSAWRPDHDLGTLLECANLAIVRLSPVDRDRVNTALERRKFVYLFGDLDGKFASWAEDQNLNTGYLRIDHLDCRNREGRSFT